MENIYSFFNGNPWLNIIFFALAIISIILAVIFYYKAIKSKKPIYDIETNRLVNNDLSGLKKIEIKYNNTIISNLSVTKIALWNSGKDSIRRNDIASSDPILVCTKDNIILYDFEIVHAKPVNNIVAEKISENSISISFEFLDFHEGIVLNVYHNGKNNNDIEIKGTLIGSEKISKAITKDYLSDKFEFMSKPINFLINHQNKFYHFIGWFVGIPIGIIILLPIFFITGPIDFVLEKFVYKIPKVFNFNK